MSTAAAPDIRVDVLLDSDEASLAEAVRAGLLSGQKQLPPRCLYDERGSQLFDRITELPEYYPARCERAILNRYAPEIVAETEAHELVEIGSGFASKTRALLYAMAGAGTLHRYVPFDVDRSVVQLSADELTSLYPGLAVHGVVGDFGRHLVDLPPPSGRRLVAFLGGTIGNLEPEARAAILRDVRGLMRPGDRLVLGADLVKDERVIVAAYDDSEGVTAQFTLNVLRVLNRELGADFDLAAFAPFARWNAREARVELGLAARSAQTVTIDGLGAARVEFAAGEEIRTEISSKFTRERLERELSHAGLRLDRLLLDDEELFSLALAVPAAGGDGADSGPAGYPRVRLEGAGALVAGGASGLGAATARALVSRGARVAVLDRDGERARELADELGGAGADGASVAVGFEADVTDECRLRAVVAEAVEAVGELRVAVSCAGIGWAERVAGREGPATLEPFETVVGVNLIGTFNVLRLTAAAMSANAPGEEGERGAVIMTASIAAFDGQIGQAAYAASKGGVVALTLPAARDLAGRGIRVCTIAPGTFDTPLLAGLPEAARAELGQQVPFPKRLGQPDEFAQLACHIAENPMLNGETIRLDGALRMPPR